MLVGILRQCTRLLVRRAPVGALAGVRAARHYAKQPVRLTAELYPLVTRDTRFAQLTADDVAHFRGILSETAVIEDNDLLLLYNEDQMRKYRGQLRLVLKPKTTEQVLAIMKHCHARGLAVVPQGGNTGLVGGLVPVFDEIVISLALMNKIRNLDKVSGIFSCDAGVILETADQHLAENGYIFPLDLGAKGSCHVGGVVATNAGGLRLLRYGLLHGLVLGLEVVMPDGEVYLLMHALRKDNTGYDLKQLFIGLEGTIGIITGVLILCPARPKAQNVAFLGVLLYEAVQEAFVHARSELLEVLSAFEFMDRRLQELCGEFLKADAHVLEEEHPFYVLIETSGLNKDHDDEKLETFLELAMELGLVQDGVVAQDETQLKQLWEWREGISEALQIYGGVYKYDVLLPLADLYLLVEAANARLAEHNLIGETDEFPVKAAVGYGHVGDGNLHLNVAIRRYTKEVEKCLEPWVYQWIKEHQGSISAEHGLGFQKKNYVGYSKLEMEIAMMKGLKERFDPQHIMNPYKYV